MSTRTAREVAVLELDPVRCDGRGLCHELLPELIGLDEWGYPLLPGGRLSARVTDDLMDHALRAVEACPVLALRLRKPD